MAFADPTRSALGLEPLEIAVLNLLLAGDHPALVALRHQLAHLSVRSREYTGVGFYTFFDLDATTVAAPVPKAWIPLGDVELAMPGLAHGAGLVLFIENGLMTDLEGFTYDEPWPEKMKDFTLHYGDAARPAVVKAFGPAA